MVAYQLYKVFVNITGGREAGRGRERQGAVTHVLRTQAYT